MVRIMALVFKYLLNVLFLLFIIFAIFKFSQLRLIFFYIPDDYFFFLYLIGVVIIIASFGLLYLLIDMAESLRAIKKLLDHEIPQTRESANPFSTPESTKPTAH